MQSTESPESYDAAESDQGNIPILQRVKASLQPSTSVSSKQNKSSSQPTQDEESQRNITFWPGDSLVGYVPRINVFTYGYNAEIVQGVFQANNRNSIFQHANDLMVKVERGLENTVCH